MIATTGQTLNLGTGPGPRGAFAPRRLTLTVALEAAPGVAAAEPPAPRRLADGLEALLTDGATLAAPAPSLCAARAFGSGSGFLPGQIIDRAI